MDTSCHVHRPKGLAGHETGFPWRTRTGLVVTVDLPSRLSEIFVTGVLLSNEHWFFMVVMVGRTVAATLVRVLCLPGS